jgi:CspA family cold shock protein
MTAARNTLQVLRSDGDLQGSEKRSEKQKRSDDRRWQMSNERRQGKVKHIITDKGFGFLRDEEAAQEYFFHRSCVEGVSFNELREGDTVEFEIVPSPKGPRAERVRRGA